MQTYKVVHKDNHIQLEEEVNTLLKVHGGVPIGGMQIFVLTKPLFMQTLLLNTCECQLKDTSQGKYISCECNKENK